MKPRVLCRWRRIALLALGLSVPGLMRATEPAVSADEAWKGIQALGLLENKLPPGSEQMSRRAVFEWQEQRARLLLAKGEAFLAAYPGDGRRWTLVLRMMENAPKFVTSWDGFDENPADVAIDTVAVAQWTKRLLALRDEAVQAPEVSPEMREAFDHRAFVMQLTPALVSASWGKPVVWGPVLAEGLAFSSKYPHSERAAPAVRLLMHAYEMGNVPAATAEVWRRFADSPNKAVASFAAGAVQSYEGFASPLELAFTALDGREVDLSKLRGKIVLIDFWATWCGPCLAELPNVKKIYAAYHEKGFEIIGVSCDSAPDSAKPSALARTGAQVLEFARKNGMTWPQHYEGKKHNTGGNALAARFAVIGIPATFLLDPAGRVVATNLRGEQLEAAVKRLMKP